ncbi:MAG: preprotein translocase subunit SecG [Pseudomonadota bacterium]|nr:preprotein translocase subunit SecG [Pseudomonadota bacterium]
MCAARFFGVDMLSFVSFVHIATAVFIICVVLLQGGSSGGLGAGFGGGSSDSQSLFGASGPTSLLGKLTYLFAALFMITSIGLTIMQGKRYDTGLKDKLKKASSEQADTSMATAGDDDDSKDVEDASNSDASQ